MVERARGGNLRSAELTEGSITITNLGELGVDQVFGVIYPPQVAVVGFGSISENKKMIATLSGDHRASDGFLGGRFLKQIDHYLQRPDQL